MSYHRCPLAPQTAKTFRRKKNDGACDGNELKVGDDALDAVDKSEVCQKSSIFGNHYIALTEDDIQTLKGGKVLAVLE